MPKTPKTALKQASLPFPVYASGNPWQIDEENPATVPMPNDVIITKVEGNYTEKDRKLWAFLVAAVWEEIEIVRIHEMRTAKINAVFQQLGGDTSTNWIWESVKRLSKTTVEWEQGEDGKRLQGISNMMNAIISKEAKASGMLRFEIPALLGEVIRNPCRFSRLRLHFMIGLSGKYAVTLYMLLEGVANKQTPVLDVQIEQLRQWLKIPEGKFEKWYDIKRFAIEPALKQINDNPEAAGFSVVMEEIKEGRAVDRVRFILSKTEGRIANEKTLQHDAKTGFIEQSNIANNSDIPSLPTSAYEQAKKVAPNFDVYFLEQEWRIWIKDKPIPKTYAGSYVGFCKNKYKNRQFK
jgi:hypothetical protein